MPAHRARSRLDHRVTSDRTLVETAGRAGPSTVTEVMTMERALKQALVPLASAALDREVDLVCEVLSDVGEYVLGDRRGFMDLVGRAVAPALARAVRGEVRVRLARQYAGFAPTDTVLVSVSIGHEGAEDVEDVEDVEIMLPIAQRLDEVEAARELAGLRVLLVVPSLHLSRVHSAAVRRFGALVEAVCDVQPACDRMRDAMRDGTPIDVLYLDDKARHLGDLLNGIRDDASLGNACGIVGTALRAGPMRQAYQSAGASLTLSTPVLPFELREAILSLRRAAGDTEGPPLANPAAPPSSVGGPRRASGMRRLRLAEVLATLAIGSESRR